MRWSPLTLTLALALALSLQPTLGAFTTSEAGLRWYSFMGPTTGPGYSMINGLTTYNGLPSTNATVYYEEFQDIPLDEEMTGGWFLAPGGPDIVPTVGNVDTIQYVHTLFEPLDDLWGASGLGDDSFPAVKAKCRSPVDNRVYAVPMAVLTHVCLYSKPVFAAHSLSPPKTWSDLIAVCDVLLDAGIDCLLGGLPSIAATTYHDFLATRMYGGAYYTSWVAGNVSFSDPRVLDVLSVLGSLGKRMAWDPTPDGGRTKASVFKLAQRTGAISCTWEALGSLLTSVSNIPDSEIGAFPFPEYDGVRAVNPDSIPPDTDGMLGFVDAYGIPKTSRNIAQAKMALAFMSAPAEAERQASLFFSDIPPRPSFVKYVTAERTQVAVNATINAPSILLRSHGWLGTQASIDTWTSFVTALQATDSEEEAQAYIADSLPVLEATRIEYTTTRTGTPRIDPPQGTYNQAIDITLTPLSNGTVIFVTLDGSNPTTSSPVYSGTITLSLSGTTVVRARALAPSRTFSSELVATYTVVLPPQNAAGDVESNTTLILAILLPILLVLIIASIVIAYLVYRRKSVTYKLSSDSELVIPHTELDVGHLIGTGSFGTVYKATWRATPVAVKRTWMATMSPTQMREFVSEAQHLVNLRHPAVVIFMGITLDPASIVTEYMARGSLHDVLHSPDFFLPPSILFKWGHAMAAGLQFLAASDIIHGDFKSLNVLLDETWTAKICDFGLSSVRVEVDESPDRKSRRKNNRVGPTPTPGSFGGDVEEGRSMELAPANNVGTLYWASPELLTGGKPSHASDAYALGVTLWEVATRAHLYKGENPVAAALAVTSEGRRPDTSLVPSSMAPLVPVMEALWETDPRQRMALDTATDSIARMFDSSRLAFPSTAEDPSGNVYITLVASPGWVARLRENPERESEALLQFSSTVERALRVKSGRVVRQGPGFAIGATHTGADAAEVVAALLALAVTSVPDLFAVVAQGDIVSIPGVGPRAKTRLAGPVMDRISSLWRDLVGGRGVDVGLNTLTPSTTSSGPGVVGVAEELPCGVYASSDLVAELRGAPNLNSEDVPEVSADVSRLYLVDEYSQARVTGSPNSVQRVELGESPNWLLSSDEIHELVGQGTKSGLGTFAKLVETTWLGTPVLVKVLLNQPSATEELVSVATVLASATQTMERVGQQSLLGPLGVCLTPPYVSFVVEFKAHGSLADILDLSRPSQGDRLVHRPSSVASLHPEITLDESTKLTIATSVAQTLARAHACTGGRGHGALKPSNILLEVEPSRGVVVGTVVSDFGLDAIKSNQGTMTAIPSAAYLAPDDVSGAGPSAASDLFVFGTLVYEMAVGEPAFKGSNAMEVAYRLVSGDRPSVEWVRNAVLREVVDRAWSGGFSGFDEVVALLRTH